MACSKACKATFAVYIAVAALAVLLFFVLYNTVFYAKLCENDGELYYEDEGSCYPKGQQGPCNDTFVLLQKQPRSPLGVCSCAYKENQRALLFHRETYKCYFIFTRGFCEAGFWLNITMEGDPVCEENRCLNQLAKYGTSIDDIVPLQGGKCAILGEPAPDCKGNETVRFFHKFIYPSCKRKIFALTNIGHIPPQQCPLGSYLNVLGKCQPQMKVDFS